MKRRGQQSRFEQTQLALPVQHRDAELGLNIPMILQPQPLQEATELGATARNYVLAVVNLLPGLAIGKGKGAPTQETSGFHQRHRIVPPQQSRRGGDAGNAATQDNYVRF